jgi:hypothetical protein
VNLHPTPSAGPVPPRPWPGRGPTEDLGDPYRATPPHMICDTPRRIYPLSLHLRRIQTSRLADRLSSRLNWVGHIVSRAPECGDVGVDHGLIAGALASLQALFVIQDRRSGNPLYCRSLLDVLGGHTA